MNHSKQILWHIILISLMNAMTYIYAEFTFIWLHTPLFCKILFAIIYGTLQLSLLFHTIKASSKRKRQILRLPLNLTPLL